MTRQQWLVFVPMTLATAGLTACASMLGGQQLQDLKVRPVETTQTQAASQRDALCESAVAAINDRDYGRALDYLQAEKAKDPRNVKALNALGVVYDKLGRFDLSARYYAQAKAIEPDSKIVAGGQAVFAPPAQILNSSTIIQRQNMLDTFLFGQLQPGGDPNPVGADNTAVVLNFAPWDALAPNPAQLVDALNQRLMHGSMSAAMRQRIIDAVTSVGTDNRQRVRTAIYIIASSMQYQVQR